ncbi:MAG: hypothetical protein ACLRQF_07260 [Thomasclavelia ramosa]
MIDLWNAHVATNTFLYIAFPLLMRSITGERFIPVHVCGAIAASINSGAYSTNRSVVELWELIKVNGKLVK